MKIFITFNDPESVIGVSTISEEDSVIASLKEVEVDQISDGTKVVINGSDIDFLSNLDDAHTFIFDTDKINETFEIK